MRTPEEWILQTLLLKAHLEKVGCYEEVVEAISEAQKEAWNEAIELAARSLITIDDREKQQRMDILKLKKP